MDSRASLDETYVSSRRVGEAVVTVVSDGELLWAPRFPVTEAEWRRAMPDADDAGRSWFGLNVVLIALGDARVVVDPALDDPGTAFEHEIARTFPPPGLAFSRSPGLGAALHELGWDPASVTHVAITHAHDDHYGGVAIERDGELAVRFPNARHLIGRADWESNPKRVLTGSELDRRLGAVERLGLLEMVDGERDIVAGITLVPSPGETPGHLAVRVHSAGETCYVLGDLMHHACELEHPDWAPPGRDLDALRLSRKRLCAAVAREQALAISAHERFPGWGRIVGSDGGYRWQSA
jgi:glyoxylase-like metal-dependent hydrolase (beta-lactamase superfamily II)